VLVFLLWRWLAVVIEDGKNQLIGSYGLEQSVHQSLGANVTDASAGQKIPASLVILVEFDDDDHQAPKLFLISANAKNQHKGWFVRPYWPVRCGPLTVTLWRVTAASSAARCPARPNRFSLK